MFIKNEFEYKKAPAQKDRSFCICYVRKLFDDFAVNNTSAASCIGFVGVDVHSFSVAVAYTNNNVAEGQFSAFAVHFNFYDLVVNETQFSSVSSGHVDVTFCNDNAFSQFNFAARTYQFASAGTSDFAGLTNWSADTDGTSIRSGKFDLSFFSERTKDGNASQLFFRANNGYSLSASVLTRLGQVFFLGEFSTSAEQDFEMQL